MTSRQKNSACSRKTDRKSYNNSSYILSRKKQKIKQELKAIICILCFIAGAGSLEVWGAGDISFLQAVVQAVLLLAIAGKLYANLASIEEN